MPFRTIPGLDLEYALISFDEDGQERTDDPAGGTFSKVVLDKISQKKPTDVFLFSHGWKGDFRSAVDQYDRWIGAMWKLKKDRDAMSAGFSPFFIGLHWPSLPWGDESLPAGASFAAAAVETTDLDELFEKAVAHFGDKPGVREALRVIFNAKKEDPGAVALTDEAIAAYRQLADAIGFSAGGDASASPEAEGAPLDPEEAVRANRVASAAVPFGSAGAFFQGILGGLGQLSFWTMKKRARRVGEGGMHAFVSTIQRSTNARVHLMGHSFGCIVVSSIVHGPQGRSSLTRPIDSVALVQGALSLWSYGDKVPGSSDPGYFHQLLTKRVAGPIVTTQSRFDSAVGVLYPAAVGLVGQADFGIELPKYGAIGAFGIQGTTAVKPLTMVDENGAYPFTAGGVYNIEASAFIKKMEGVSGAHSDIDGPQVAHMLWQVARPRV
jgi:hypothetical protein